MNRDRGATGEDCGVHHRRRRSRRNCGGAAAVSGEHPQPLGTTRRTVLPRRTAEIESRELGEEEAEMEDCSGVADGGVELCTGDKVGGTAWPVWMVFYWSGADVGTHLPFDCLLIGAMRWYHILGASPPQLALLFYERWRCGKVLEMNGQPADDGEFNSLYVSLSFSLFLYESIHVYRST